LLALSQKGKINLDKQKRFGKKMDSTTFIKVQKCKRNKDQKLDLSGSSISLIPADVMTLTSLRELDLSNNRLQSIDPNISNLTNLNYLNISNNCIKELPSSLADLTTLQYLNMAGNPLDDIFLPLQNANPRNLHN
jgi:Leucine-rich repeat (LRR) protein